MDYLDLLKDLANEEGEIDPTSATAVLNGATRELSALQQKIAARFPEDANAPKETAQKPRSAFTMAEKAQFFAEQRENGRDPVKAWKALPK